MERKKGDLSELMTSEGGKVRSLKNCITYLKVKGGFHSEAIELRQNTITLEDWEKFARNPSSTRLFQ